MHTAVAHHLQPDPERPLASSPQVMCWAQWNGLEYSSGQAVSVFPTVSTPSPQCLPCSLLKAEKSFIQWTNCSAPTQTSMYYQHHSLPKSKTCHWGSSQEED